MMSLPFYSMINNFFSSPRSSPTMPRQSRNASTPPQPTISHGYSLRTRRNTTPLASDRPLQTRASRGNVAKPYGEVERVRLSSGVTRLDSTNELADVLDSEVQANSTRRTTKSRTPASASSPGPKEGNTTQNETNQTSVDENAQASKTDGSLSSVIHASRSFGVVHESGLPRARLRRIIAQFMSKGVKETFMVIFFGLIIAATFIFASFLFYRHVIINAGSLIPSSPFGSKSGSGSFSRRPKTFSGAAECSGIEAKFDTWVQSFDERFNTWNNDQLKLFYKFQEQVEQCRSKNYELEIELSGFKARLDSIERIIAAVPEFRKLQQDKNWFSSNLGAVIDPRYTSPTNPGRTSLYERLYFTFLRNPAILPPIQAIMPWTEPGDCWCAAPSEKGRLSLGIRMRHRVSVSGLTVEHVPAGTAIDIHSAPKKLEFWGRIGPLDKIKSNPSCEPWLYPGKEDGWVCLHAWTYDVKAAFHVQSTAIPPVPGYPDGVSVDRAVVRVVENYGQDYSCLYRVKLHGELDR